MGLAGSSDCDLLGWSTLAVDGDQFMVRLAEVKESGLYASGSQYWPVLCCQHVNCHSHLRFCSTCAGSNDKPLHWIASRLLMCWTLSGSHMEQAYSRTCLATDL